MPQFKQIYLWRFKAIFHKFVMIYIKQKNVPSNERQILSILKKA